MVIIHLVGILVVYILILVFSFIISPIFGQNPFWDNNLSTSQITGMTQEGNSYWLSCYGGGLIKFDPTGPGATFFNKHNSSIPSVCMSAIVVDSLGNKWIGTNDGKTGLIRFNGLNTWTVFNNQNTPLLSNIINCLTWESNTLWVGTSKGLTKFDGLTWISYDSAVVMGVKYPLSKISDIAIDTAGNLWLSCTGVGLFHFNGTKWTIYNDTNSSIHCGPFNYVYCVTFDTIGNCFVGHALGMSVFNGNTWTYYGSTPQIPISDLVTDHNGVIYGLDINGIAGTWTGSNWIWIGNGIIPSYTYPLNLWQHSKLYIDHSNNLWLMNILGIAKYDNAWTDFTSSVKTQLLLDGITRALYLPLNNELYVSNISFPTTGVGSGITQYDGNMWQQFDVLEPCTNNNIIYCIAGSHNNIWMGIRNGVSHYNGSIFQNHYFSNCASVEFTNSIVENIHGIYVGTRKSSYPGRLHKFDGINWSIVPTILDGNPNASYNCMKYFNDYLLIGSNTGLIVYDSLTGSTLYNSLNSALPNDTVNDILVDGPNNFVWLATNHGIVKTDLINWNLYNSGNSNIPEDKVTCISQDSLSQIWLGTEKSGIAMFDGNNFTSYNTLNSGLTDDRINTIFTGLNNSIYVGTLQGGLPVFHYGLWLADNHYDNQAPGMRAEKIIIKPNPFSENVKIEFSFGKCQEVSAVIYNSTGQKIRTLITEYNDHESYICNWDGKDDAGNATNPGIYFCVFRHGQESTTGKLIRLPKNH